MNNIPIAQKINYYEKEKDKGIYEIEPLYPGYGLTLGNALRRVLLSSLDGAAIKAVKIKGVDHEFSTLDWVKEDMVDIVLNLKLVRIKIAEEMVEQAEKTGQEIRLKLTVKGEREVKAKDFEKVAGIEIVNPNQVIATLTDAAAQLEMEVVLGYGRGYAPTEMRTDENYEIGMMTIDAIYTPVKRVGYEIENVRVGQMTNWDKLILSIETDGTITPQDAFEKAVGILVEQFSGLIKQEDKEVLVKEKNEEIKEESIDTESTENTKTQKTHTEEEGDLVSKDKGEMVDEGGEKEVEEEKPKKKRGRPRKEN